MDKVRILTAGEQGLVVEFGHEINEAHNRMVHRLAALIQQHLRQNIIEVVPTYRSLLVYFQPLSVSRQHVKESILKLLTQLETEREANPAVKVTYIPVCYDDEFAPDLGFVAEHNGLSAEEVMDIHTATPYRIYMLGFTPGYAYLGGLSSKIAAPRLQQPRTKVPAGSVAIGGTQTAFYTVESPGGWRLIGRTPVQALDFASTPPFLFRAGEYLQFQRVSRQEYEEIALAVRHNAYTPHTDCSPGGKPL